VLGYLRLCSYWHVPILICEEAKILAKN